jgi:hypothetical protein
MATRGSGYPSTMEAALKCSGAQLGEKSCSSYAGTPQQAAPHTCLSIAPEEPSSVEDSPSPIDRGEGHHEVVLTVAASTKSNYGSEASTECIDQSTVDCGSEPASPASAMSPHKDRQAQDGRLVRVFLGLAGIQKVQLQANSPGGVVTDLDGLVDYDPRIIHLTQRAIAFLRAVNYAYEDICVVLAHASVYFPDVVDPSQQMGASEAGYILVLLMYLGHAYAIDDACELTVWQRCLFREYCSLATLDQAVVALLKMRNCILRVHHEDVHERAAMMMSCL